MGQRKAGADALGPLLIELARAVRAHQFYPAPHASRIQSIERATQVWGSGLARAGELELEVSEAGFALAGAPLGGPGLDELARTLASHRVLGVQVHPALEPEELRSFVEALARDPDSVEQAGGLAATLRGAGVRHLAVWELPGAVPTDAGDPAQPGEPGGAHPEQASVLTVELVKQLAELERCEEPGTYRPVADRVGNAVSRLIEAKNYVDAYRAALVFCRHIADLDGRAAEVRREAREHLRSLSRYDAMLRFVLERSCASTGVTKVQAVQVLIELAPDSVPLLLQEHARGDGEVRDQATSILITMGERAFPVIVEELDAEDPAKARRAVRLIGDMQNPRGVDHLADRLNHRDASLRREVATALARIGTTRAVRVLADALADRPEVALLAASALGGCSSKSAVRALVESVAERSGRPPEVRREAIRSLGRIGDPDALRALREILKRSSRLGRKRNRPLRVAAAHAIGKIGGEEARAALTAHAEKGDEAVQEACREALAELLEPVG